MKNSILLVLSTLLITLIFNGCGFQKGREVTGTGDPVSKSVTVPAFHGIRVIGTCSVEVTVAEDQRVVLTAQHEILDVMHCEVSGGILLISFDDDITINTSEEIKASVMMPEISEVGLDGVGNFTLAGPTQDQLDITLVGTGNVHSYDMPVEKCYINISGTGNCNVLVNDLLDVTISGVGFVYYRGNPEVKSYISGVGDVIDDNE